MDKIRWQLVEELFQELVELTEPERESSIAALKKDDPELAREVLSLLQASQEEASLAMVSDEFQHLGLEEVSSLEGKKLGPYRVLHPLGTGGTSTVLLAVRDDGTYHRQVAIKLLNAGFRSSEFLKLFYREQQILAGLNHPNIARLLDAGHTENGLPYLVTEYVEGVPLDVYCRSHQLRVHECLNVFTKVCEAVIFAHQNLIIHRDLKPNNILVNQEGEPILLDFGFAKMLNANFSTKGASSQIWMRMLTPAYASPEQLLGHPMTTSSDIFSLGIILYELLSGHRPFDCEGLDLKEIEHLLCDKEPRRPSQAVLAKPSTSEREKPQALRYGLERRSRQLKGDLDAIILKALRKEPQYRYTSVPDLLEDIKRFAEKRPVRARKDSFFYRTGKYFGRNWGMLAASICLMGVLLTFSHSQSNNAKNLAIALEKARVAQHNNDETISFLADLFRSSDPHVSKGENLSAREFLDRAANRIFEEFEGQPKSKFQLMVLMGQVYVNMGLYQDAMALLEKGAPVAEDKDVSQLELAYFEHLYGIATFEKGDLDEAQEKLQKAFDRKVKVLGRNHPDLAENFFQLGRVQIASGNFREAKAYLQEGETLLLASGQQDQELAFEFGIAKSEIDIHFGTYDMAIGRLVTLREKAMANLAENDALNFEIANQLGLAYKRKGRFDDAEKMYRWVIDRSETLYGEEHPFIAEKRVNLGALFHAKGDLDAAEKLYLKALEVLNKHIETKHDDILTTRGNLGALYYAKKNYPEAVSLFKGALEIQEKHYGVGHPSTCRTRANLAMSFNKMKQKSEAESLLRLNIALLKDQSLTDHDIYMLNVQNLGSILVDSGSFEAAIPYLREADMVMRKKGNKDIRFANNLCKYGFALGQVGHAEAAEPHFEMAREIFEKAFKPEDKRFEVLQLYAGYNQYLLGRKAEGLDLILGSFSGASEYLGPENTVIVRVRSHLGDLGHQIAVLSPDPRR